MSSGKLLLSLNDSTQDSNKDGYKVGDILEITCTRSNSYPIIYFGMDFFNKQVFNSASFDLMEVKNNGSILINFGYDNVSRVDGLAAFGVVCDQDNKYVDFEFEKLPYEYRIENADTSYGVKVTNLNIVRNNINLTATGQSTYKVEANIHTDEAFKRNGVLSDEGVNSDTINKKTYLYAIEFPSNGPHRFAKFTVNDMLIRPIMSNDGVFGFLNTTNNKTVFQYRPEDNLFYGLTAKLT